MSKNIFAIEFTNIVPQRRLSGAPSHGKPIMPTTRSPAKFGPKEVIERESETREKRGLGKTRCADTDNEAQEEEAGEAA